MVADSIRSLYQVLATVESAICCASIIANLLLIYLIAYRTSRELGSYRHLLLAFAINDVYFPIVHLLTLPVVCTYKDAFIMFANGLLTSKYAICLYGSAYSQSMPLLAHLFIYRLVALKWPTFIQLYTARNCFLLTIFTVLVEGSLWYLHCLFNYDSDQEAREYVQPFLEEYFHVKRKEFIGAHFFTVDGYFIMRSFVSTMGFNAVMAICMAVIMFCTVSTISLFRSIKSNISGKTKRLQQQLFCTLMLQISKKEKNIMIFPMLLVYLPCAGLLNLALFGKRISVFPNLMPAIASLYPVTDAVIVMFGVKSYRVYLLQFFNIRAHSTGDLRRDAWYTT